MADQIPPDSRHPLKGFFFALAGSVLLATNYIVAKYALRGIDALTFAFIWVGVAAVLMLIVLAVQGKLRQLAVPRRCVKYIIILGLFACLNQGTFWDGLTRLDPAGTERLIRWATTLNKAPMEAALACGATAATDITGFGLLLHVADMSSDAVTVEIDAGAVPLLDGAKDLAIAGVVPGGTRANLAHATNTTRFPENMGETMRLLLADAQTSGGLVVAVPPDTAIRFEDEMANRDAACWRIGRLVPRRAHAVEGLAP